MLDSNSYDIPFSDERPEAFLKMLLAILQEETNLAEIKRVPQSLLTVLIIDRNVVRSDSIVQLMNAVGYRSQAVASALEAFTQFLKGLWVPQIIVLSQDNVSDPLFLQRLLQQIQQRYQFKVPLAHLFPDPTAMSVSRQPSQPLLQFSAPEQAAQTGNIEQVEREKLLLTGQSTGRYQIATLLGVGAQGNVYRAYDRLREQEIAFKTMQVNTVSYVRTKVSAEDVNLFQQECDMLSKLEHPNILVPSNAGRSYISGSAFVFKTMSYFPERSLAYWFSHQGKKVFSPQEILPLIMQLADVLHYIHEHQIIYQNFKLSNLLIRKPTKDLRKMHLLLSDFPITQDGSFFSHVPEAFPYMAPERWLGRALPASDQYGLAVLAYELLVGHPPFQGSSEYTMRFLHLNMQPQIPGSLRATLPPAVSAILLRALAKRPEDRFPTVEAFAKNLQRYC